MNITYSYYGGIKFERKGNYYFWRRLRLLFLEDEAVVEKKIDNHDDDGVKGESASGKNEFIGKWKMESATDIVGKIVEWGEHAEKLGETRSDEKSEQSIPDKEADDCNFGNMTLFPSDFGMRNVSYDGSKSGGDKIGKPKKVTIVNENIRNNGKKCVVE